MTKAMRAFLYVGATDNPPAGRADGGRMRRRAGHQKGQVTGFTAQLKMAIVDRAGQLP